MKGLNLTLYLIIVWAIWGFLCIFHITECILVIQVLFLNMQFYFKANLPNGDIWQLRFKDVGNGRDYLQWLWNMKILISWAKQGDNGYLRSLMHKKLAVCVSEALEQNFIYFMYPKCDGCIRFFFIREITPRSLGEISSVLAGPKGEVALKWPVNLGFLKKV